MSPHSPPPPNPRSHAARAVDTTPAPAPAPTVAASLASATTLALPVPWHAVRGVLFDVDGTLTDSDDLHFRAFQELLLEAGHNGGVAISRAFFDARISGRHNPDIAADLFPAFDAAERAAFSERKEAYFRELAATCAPGEAL
jgi:hypothetical protein